MTLKIYTDGGAKGNPGPAAIGTAFYLNEKNIFKHKENIGIATNNVAEYLAVIKALENIKNQISKIKNVYQVSNIQLFSDSQLLINQVRGLFKVKNSKIREFILKIRMLEQEIDLPISYHLIPREKNRVADKLVKESGKF